MDLVNLANGMTVWLSEVRHQFWPQGRLVMVVTLCPTVGVPYTRTLDLLRSWQLQWDEGTDDGVLAAFLGKDVAVLKAALVVQYETFVAEGSCNDHLLELFRYISTTGISP